tara:strand:+ start:568 stop:891 length:324 start_codon:yes stop_codon:yes gene_type:complete
MSEPIFTDDELDGIHRTKFLKKLEETAPENVASGLSLYSDLSDSVAELDHLYLVLDKSYKDLSDRVAELEKGGMPHYHHMRDRVAKLEKFVENLQRSVGKFIKDFGS